MSLRDARNNHRKPFQCLGWRDPAETGVGSDGTSAGAAADADQLIAPEYLMTVSQWPPTVWIRRPHKGYGGHAERGGKMKGAGVIADQRPAPGQKSDKLP